MMSQAMILVDLVILAAFFGLVGMGEGDRAAAAEG